MILSIDADDSDVEEDVEVIAPKMNVINTNNLTAVGRDGYVSKNQDITNWWATHITWYVTKHFKIN